VVVGSDLVLTWFSVVPVPSLGLLLGRDWLDGVGCVLSFAKKVMRVDHLSGRLISLHQILAGHFALPLVPRQWPVPGALKWRRVGLDGVLELQMSHHAWLQRKLHAESFYMPTPNHEHEHLVTEQSVMLADVRFSGLDASSRCHHLLHDALVQEMNTSQSSEIRDPPPTSASHEPARSGTQVCRKMASLHASRPRKSSMACPWNFALAAAAACLAMSATAVSSSGHYERLGQPSFTDAGSWSNLKALRSKDQDRQVDDLRGTSRLLLASGSPGSAASSNASC